MTARMDFRRQTLPSDGSHMFAANQKSKSFVCFFAAALVLHFGGFESAAKTDETSLFLIQSPPLPRSPSGDRALIAAFPASAQTESQFPLLETPPPSSSRRKTQRIDFNSPEPVQVEDDDLLKEIKALDESLAEESSAGDDKDVLDSLIEESAGKDDGDADQDEKVNGTGLERPSPPPVTTWAMKPMSSISPSLRPTTGESPEDQSWQLTSRVSVPLAASKKLYAWAAPNIKHTPLYFEDVALERYGQTKGLLRQPFASGIHFLKSAAFLPYYSVYDPINSCDGPLGYCRPGTPLNCVDQRHYFGNPFRR